MLKRIHLSRFLFLFIISLSYVTGFSQQTPILSFIQNDNLVYFNTVTAEIKLVSLSSSIIKNEVPRSMTFNSKEDVLGIEVYIIKDQSIYESLEKDKDEIEKEIGEKLSWQPLPGRSASRIKADRNNSILDNDSEWNSYIDWSIEKLEKFYHTFKSRLKNID